MSCCSNRAARPVWAHGTREQVAGVSGEVRQEGAGLGLQGARCFRQHLFGQRACPLQIANGAEFLRQRELGFQRAFRAQLVARQRIARPVRQLLRAAGRHLLRRRQHPGPAAGGAAVVVPDRQPVDAAVLGRALRHRGAAVGHADGGHRRLRDSGGAVPASVGASSTATKVSCTTTPCQPGAHTRMCRPACRKLPTRSRW